MKKQEITLSQLVDRFMDLTPAELKAFNTMIEALNREKAETALKQQQMAETPIATPKTTKKSVSAWYAKHTKTGEKIILVALNGGGYDKTVGEILKKNYKAYWFKGHGCWAIVKPEGIKALENSGNVIHKTMPKEYKGIVNI